MQISLLKGRVDNSRSFKGEKGLHIQVTKCRNYGEEKKSLNFRASLCESSLAWRRKKHLLFCNRKKITQKTLAFHVGVCLCECIMEDVKVVKVN